MNLRIITIFLLAFCLVPTKLIAVHCEDYAIRHPTESLKYGVKISHQRQDNHDNVSLKMEFPKLMNGCGFKAAELMRYRDERILLSTDLVVKKAGNYLQVDGISISRTDLDKYRIALFYGDDEKCSCVSSVLVEHLSNFVD